MITDIKIIKKELKNFSQIEFPYDIKRNCHVKYLTLKGNQEYFYTGGKFIRFGNECLIFLKTQIKLGVYLNIEKIKKVISYIVVNFLYKIMKKKLHVQPKLKNYILLLKHNNILLINYL